MRKIRNAVVIIILCLIGAYKEYTPNLNAPSADGLRDALSGRRGDRASRSGLRLSSSDDDQLHDSVSGNAIPAHGDGGPRGNTDDGIPPPPRGGDHNGFGPLSGPNPGSQFKNLPNPGRLSQSGPPQ